jgi:putative flippase GtrA
MFLNAVLIKLSKFMLVGMGGTILDFSVTFLLKEKLHINKYIANSAGFLVAATSNYIFNRIWAFESHSSNILGQYLIFISVSLVGLGILNGSVWFMHERWNWNFYFSKTIALFMVLAWTFLAHYFITFSMI